MQSGTFLGEVEISAIYVADGRHDGMFEVHVDGLLINQRAVAYLEQSAPVVGVDSVYVSSIHPVVRVAVTLKEDGKPMSKADIKKVAQSFIRALTTWANNLSSGDLARFTEHEPLQGTGSASTLAVYGDAGRI